MRICTGPRYLTEALPAPQRETLENKQRELVQVYRSLIDEGIAAGQFMPTATAIAAFNVLAIVQYSGVWYRPRKGRRAADVIEAQSAAVLNLSVPAPAPWQPHTSGQPRPGPPGAANELWHIDLPGVEELDFQGPWEMIGMWHKYSGGPRPLLLARTLEPVTCAHGMRVLPDLTFEQADGLTELLVPGGYAAFDEMKQPDITAMVRRHFDTGGPTLSVCSQKPSSCRPPVCWPGERHRPTGRRSRCCAIWASR